MSAVDEVVSSQPIVTDPNEAWGGEPSLKQSITTDPNQAWCGKPFPNKPHDPFGDDALSKPFETNFSNNSSASKDPFE